MWPEMSITTGCGPERRRRSGSRPRTGDADAVVVVPALPPGWRADDDRLTLSADAAPSDPYVAAYDPLAPPLPALDVTVTVGETQAVQRLPLDETPVVLPPVTAELSPDAALLNLATSDRSVSLRLGGAAPDVTVTPPEGWQMHAEGDRMTLTAPDALKPGLHEARLESPRGPVMTVRRFAHPHIPPRARAFPAVLGVRVLKCDLPGARIGYVGGGNDNVAHWLDALGCDVTVLGDPALGDREAMAGFDTLLVGVFAIRTRPALRAAMPRLHDWIAAGGNLVTLYHRPWDAWDPDTVPPRRLEIGQPSLRWRVTDETAEVTALVPDHPLLTSPNRIGPDDWAGWHKERGLYFARDWADEYVPLLSMADPGEAPHKGALLSARIGDGRHTHCALILHHQMEKLVPGAFRLMANLLTPA